MHRAGDTRVVGPDEHLCKELDVPVLGALGCLPGSKGVQVMLDVGVVLAGGDDAVAMGDPAVFVKIIGMIQNASRNFHCANAEAAFWRDGLARFLPA